jgi:Yip1 domain
MITGSLAVFTRPSLSTFEEHERDNLAWATIYIAIAAAINGLLGAIGSLIRAPFIAAQLQDLENQFAELGAAGGDVSGFTEPMIGFIQATANPIVNMISNTISTLVGFYIVLGIIFVIGLALGGTGRFGHLAYDLALINAPTSVIYAVVSLVAIGPVAILVSLVTLGVWIYSLVLTYFGIRAGMNLTHGKALTIVLLPAILIFLIFACSCAFIVLVVLGAASSP